MTCDPTLEQIADGEFGGLDLGRRFAREILDQQNEHDNLVSNMAASLAEIEERLGEEHPRSYSERCSEEELLRCEAQRDTARAALRKIVEAYQGHCLAHQIATDALAGGEANEGSGDA